MRREVEIRLGKARFYLVLGVSQLPKNLIKYERR